MIFVVEIQCEDWEHEQVNAGFLKQLRDAEKNRSIVFFGDKRHIKRVDSIYSCGDHNVETCAVSFPSRHKAYEEMLQDYVSILEGILKETDETPTDVFILSVSDKIVLAVYEIAKRYDTRFHLVFHSRLERELMTCRNGSTGKQTMQEVLNSVGDAQIQFICYSPTYKEFLRPYLSSTSMNHMRFMHHPFVPMEISIPKDQKEKTIIGIYGAAINEKAVEFIRNVNKSRLKDSIVFQVLCKKDNRILEEQNVFRFMDGNQNPNAEQINSFIQHCDYILIPYPKDTYRATASGLFWDAVRNMTPVLTLDSPYFKFYEKYHIGITEESSQKLVDRLTNHLEMQDSYADNAVAMMNQVTRENIFAIQKMISGL